MDLAVRNFTLVGIEQVSGSGGEGKGSTFSLLGTSKGNFRFETSKDGLPVRAATFDGQHGQYSVGSNAAKPLPPHAILNMPPLFPLPSLAAAVTKDRVAVIDRGSTQWDGAVVRVVEMRTIFPSQNPHESKLNHLTAKLFYLDPVSGQLMGISFRSYSLANSNVFVESSVHYSDFSSEHGITYPHTVIEYRAQQKTQKITFTSLTINSGLDDSHFHL